MSSVTFPPLPAAWEAAKSSDPAVALFVPMIEPVHASLVELTGVYERVREADARGDEALENSDAEAAVDYRDAQEEATQAIELVEAEVDAEIKALRSAAAERKSRIRKELKAERDAALAKLGAEITGDVDLDALQADYAVKLKTFTGVLNLLKENVPDFVEYRKSLPSSAKQAKGSTTSETDKRWSPRLSAASVDGNSVTPATLGNVTKAIGIKASEGGRALLVTQILAKTVTQDNFTETVEFDITYGGKVHNVSVTPTVKAATEDSESDAPALVLV